MAVAKSKRPWGGSGHDRDEQHEMKRQVVLRTAARAYTQRGFHESTLADIADELNISKPLLYYYFKNKDEILFECHRIGIEAVTDGETPMLEAHEATGRQRLHQFLRRYVRMVVDDFGTCLVMTGTNALEPENLSVVIAGRRRIDGMLRSILDDGLKDGTPESDNRKAIHDVDASSGRLIWIPTGSTKADRYPWRSSASD